MLFIKDTNPNHPIGAAVQQYAHRHFRQGLTYGFVIGLCVGIGIALAAKRT